MRWIRLAGPALCVLTLAAASASTGERRADAAGPAGPAATVSNKPHWGLPDVLPVSEEVRDPVFALLVGLVEEDLYGVITQDRLLAEVARSGRRSRLPVKRLGTIRRTPPEDDTGNPSVSLSGRGPVDVPVPYDILGYHPGRFRASSRSRFQEWNLGTVVLDVGRWKKGSGAEPTEFHEVRMWGLVEGRVEMDVDGWLDVLLGSKLDDTAIVGLALFRFEGELYGVATGYSKKGKGRSGAFRFSEDKLVYPNRPAFKAMGSYVRGRLERELPGLRRLRRP